MKSDKKRKSGAIRTIKIVSIVITSLILVFLIYSLVNISSLDEKVSSLVYNYGAPALFAISVLLDLIPQLISPVIALSTAIIAGTNVHEAIAAAALGSTIGSLIGFSLGKKYMFDAVDVMTSEKTVEKITHLTNKYGRIIVPIAAISPLPYLPVFLGAINFSNRNFIIFGILPRVISIITFGYLVNLI